MAQVEGKRSRQSERLSGPWEKWADWWNASGGNTVAMESNMVEENGNSSLDPLGGESASGHNNTDDNSTHQSQQSQLSSALHHHQQDAAPSGAVLATSANIVQFIPTQSVQVNAIKMNISIAILHSRSRHFYMLFRLFCPIWHSRKMIFTVEKWSENENFMGIKQLRSPLFSCLLSIQLPKKIVFFLEFILPRNNVCEHLMPRGVVWKWKGNVLRNFSFDNILFKIGVGSYVSTAHRNQTDQPYLIVMW